MQPVTYRGPTTETSLHIDGSLSSKATSSTTSSRIDTSGAARQRMLKLSVLVLMVLQTTALVLLLRYSRIQPTEGRPRYLNTTAVFLAELLKMFVCILLVARENGWSAWHTWDAVAELLVRRPLDTVKVCVPGVLFLVQNNLLFTALSNLDAATYQVTYQLKILTTALFSVFLLRKLIRSHQWAALMLLALGVALVQIQDQGRMRQNNFNASFVSPPSIRLKSQMSTEARSLSAIGLIGTSDGSQKWNAAAAAVVTGRDAPQVRHGPSTEPNRNMLLGLGAVLLACFSSGFAGVYFEKILKDTAPSVWMRNIQLGLFGSTSGIMAVYLIDGAAVRANGFFQGYDSITWIVIFLQAVGGLIIANVIKYTDNIIKGFAAAISIVLSAICSYYLLQDTAITLSFVSGSGLVICATFLYGAQLQLPCCTTNEAGAASIR